MQRNTGVVARALSRTQLVAILARVVDTTVIFVCRRRERKGAGRKNERRRQRTRRWIVSLCWQSPLLFSLPFYLFTRTFVSVLLPLYRSGSGWASLFLLRFHQADDSRTSPPFELPAGNVAYLAGYLPWREGYTSSSSCQIHGKRFSAKAGYPWRRFYVLLGWEKPSFLANLANSERSNRSFKAIFNLLHFFTLKILPFFESISSIFYKVEYYLNFKICRKKREFYPCRILSTMHIIHLARTKFCCGLHFLAKSWRLNRFLITFKIVLNLLRSFYI